jgi:dedicator of cytokinesis protein 3
LFVYKQTAEDSLIRADSLAVMIKVFHGEAPTIIKENPSLLQDTPLTARLGFPDVVFPGDVRNEVFIKLWSGEFFFSSGGSIRIRKSVASFAGTTVGPCNIQVSVEVRTRVGQVIENAISQGAGEPPVTQFHSMIFYRNNTPTFGELIKLQLPIDLMQQCHLFFTFRHRSSKERALPVGSRMSGMPDSMGSTSDRPFAYGYLPLFPDGQEFVQDGSHTLVLYRADKSPRQSPEEYYGAPATIAAGLKPELLGIPPHLSRSAIPIRDSLVIRSYLCSTKYTQNPVLLGLLNWEKLSDKSELSTVLSKFTFVGEVEIVKFLSDIFDSLFAILVSGVNQHSELDDLVFNALVTVLGIVQDRRFNNFQPVLDVYIEQHFSCASAASHIIHSMNRLLSNPTGADTASPLRSAFKVWHYIFKFIIRARELQKTKEVGMGATSEHLDASFKREIWAHLGEVNKLMSSPAPSSIIGTQTIALQHFTSILPDLSDVFSKLELVSIATGFANAVTPGKGKIVIWKLVMYLQLVRGFLFDSPQSRSLLLEAVISWIKPHFGRYDEYAHTQQNNVEAVRDAARVSWLESIRLSITIIAVMLDKLQQALVNPAITGERKLYRQEQDNVEYTLSLLPRYCPLTLLVLLSNRVVQQGLRIVSRATESGFRSSPRTSPFTKYNANLCSGRLPFILPLLSYRQQLRQSYTCRRRSFRATTILQLCSRGDRYRPSRPHSLLSSETPHEFPRINPRH